MCNMSKKLIFCEMRKMYNEKVCVTHYILLRSQLQPALYMAHADTAMVRDVTSLWSLPGTLRSV